MKQRDVVRYEPCLENQRHVVRNPKDSADLVRRQTPASLKFPREYMTETCG